MQVGGTTSEADNGAREDERVEKKDELKSQAKEEEGGGASFIIGAFRTYVCVVN